MSKHELDDTRTTSTGKRESIGSSTGVAIPFERQNNYCLICAAYTTVVSLFDLLFLNVATFSLPLCPHVRCSEIENWFENYLFNFCTTRVFPVIVVYNIWKKRTVFHPRPGLHTTARPIRLKTRSTSTKVYAWTLTSNDAHVYSRLRGRTLYRCLPSNSQCQLLCACKHRVNISSKTPTSKPELMRIVLSINQQQL